MSTPSFSDRGTVTGLLRLDVDDSIELQCPSCIGPARHIFTESKFWFQRPTNAITVSEFMDAIKAEFQMVGEYRMYLDNFNLLPATSADVFDDYNGYIRIARNLDCPVRTTEDDSVSSLTFYLHSPIQTSTPIEAVSGGNRSFTVRRELMDADVDHDVPFTLFSTNDEIPSSEDSTTVYSKDYPEINASRSSGENLEVTENENGTSNKSEEANSITRSRTVIEVEDRKNVSEMDQNLNLESEGSATDTTSATGSDVHMAASQIKIDVAMMNEDSIGSCHRTPLFTSTPLIGNNSINFELGGRVPFPLEGISNVWSSISPGVHQRDSSDPIHNASSSKSDEDSVAAGDSGDTVIRTEEDPENDAERKRGASASSYEELEGVGATSRVSGTTADLSSSTGSGTSDKSEIILASNSFNSTSASAVTDNCFKQLTDPFNGNDLEGTVDSARNELATAGGNKRKSSLFQDSECSDKESDYATSSSSPSKKSKQDSQELPTDSAGGSSGSLEMAETSQKEVNTVEQVSFDSVSGDGGTVIQNADLEDAAEIKSGTSVPSDEELEGVGTTTRVSGTTADFISGTGTDTRTNNTRSGALNKSEIILASNSSNSTSASAVTDNCINESTDPFSGSQLDGNVNSARNELETAGGRKRKSSLFPDSEFDENESDCGTHHAQRLRKS